MGHKDSSRLCWDKMGATDGPRAGRLKGCQRGHRVLALVLPSPGPCTPLRGGHCAAARGWD